MAIPNKPFVLGVLGVVIFITGIITMGTGIQTGKDAGGLSLDPPTPLTI